MKNKLLAPWTLTVALFLSLAAMPTSLLAQLVYVSAITNNGNIIGISFGNPVTLPSATNPTNYFVYNKTGMVSIAGVSLNTNAHFVTLQTATPVGEFLYIAVSNVVDTATNVINAE